MSRRMVFNSSPRHSRRANRLVRLLAIFAFASGCGLWSPGWAQDMGMDNERPLIGVAVDEARILRLDRSPASVVVGNPLIADTVVDASGALFLIGRTYGTTNLIAVDASGEVVAHYEIVVRTSGRNAVSLFRGRQRIALSCSPSCETELDVGDAAEHYDKIRQQVEGKVTLSQAQAKAFSQ